MTGSIFSLPENPKLGYPRNRLSPDKDQSRRLRMTYPTKSAQEVHDYLISGSRPGALEEIPQDPIYDLDSSLYFQ